MRLRDAVEGAGGRRASSHQDPITAVSLDFWDEQFSCELLADTRGLLGVGDPSLNAHLGFFSFPIAVFLDPNTE